MREAPGHHLAAHVHLIIALIAARQIGGRAELSGFEQRQVGGESFVEVAYGLAEDGRGMQLREAIDVLVDAGAATADAKVRLGLALRSRVSEGGPLVLLAELDLEIGVLLRAAWRRV